MDPRVLADVQTPLLTAARALDEAGRGRGHDYYSGVEFDPAYDGVDLYLTDTSKSTAFVSDAHDLSPFDTSLVKVFKSMYTKDEEHAARDDVWAKHRTGALPYKVRAVSVPADGSGVELEVDDVDKAKAHYVQHPELATSPYAPGSVQSTLGLRKNVPSKFVKDRNIVPSVYRWADSTPFIAGDLLTDGRMYCSAGIPAVSFQNIQELFTAAHCFGDDAYVYTGNSSMRNSWDFSSLGNYVGRVSHVSPDLSTDTIQIDQTYGSSSPGNNADEGDTNSTYHPITRIDHAYPNQYVCQDGIVEYYILGRVVCNIIVDNNDTQVTYSGTVRGTYTVYGSLGHALDNDSRGNKVAGMAGDSGGLVFTNLNDGTKDAVGMFSGYSADFLYYGGVNNTYQPEMRSDGSLIPNAGKQLILSDAVSILNDGGASLNPKT
jgi:hypothetical protein